MKTNIVMTFVNAVMFMVFFSNSLLFATEYGSDLLNGTGGFETEADRAAWGLWNTTGGGPSEFNTTLPYSGSWSWHAGPAVAYGNQMMVFREVDTVANREHRLTAKVRSQVSTPSSIKYAIGSSGYLNLTYYSSSWGSNTKYYTTGSTENTVALAIKMIANSANDNIYVDDVTLYRERCLPDPDGDSFNGLLPAGEPVTLTIYCGDGNDGTYDLNFDPDITVSSDEADINSVTWINDKEIDVNLTITSQDGNVPLILTNVYSNLQVVYQIKVDKYGSDILNGTGGFETEADRATWELWNTTGGGPSEFNTTLPYSYSWSWHAGPAVAYANQMMVFREVDTVANREHCLMAKVRSQVSTPSWIRYAIGSSGYLNLTYYSSSWGNNTKYYTTTSTENAIDLTFKMYANSANDNIYVDDVTLYRERCLPDPNGDSSDGILYYGQENAFSISCVHGDPNESEYKRLFDPDITVSCDDADINSVTWINDYQIDVVLTPTSDDDGTIELVLCNEYSGLSSTYVMELDSFGADLLNGTGDFETEADRAIWELWNTVPGTSEFSMALPYSGDWSWHAGPAVAYADQMMVSRDVDTVANREHRLTAKVRTQVSTPSWIRYAIGSSGYLDLTYYSTGWGLNTKYYTTTSTENAIDLAFKMYANSANDNMYVDDVTLCRERCLPDPNGDSFGGLLPYGQRCEFSIYCDGQSDGVFNRKFDSDILITSEQATIYDINWVSDYQVDINMITICGYDEEVEFVITNAESDLTSVYTMKYIYGSDLLSVSGDFDDPNSAYITGDRSLWTISTSGEITSEFTTYDYASPAWSWYSEGGIGSSTASLTHANSIQTFGGREHCLVCNAKKLNTPSSVTVEIGQGLPANINLVSNEWISNVFYYNSNSDETNLDLIFDVDSDSSGDTVYLDDVSLRCQRSIPCPNGNSLTGPLSYEEPATVSIYSESGYDGYARKAFDPDINVVSDEAYIESVTWVSDTQIDVNLTPFYGGQIVLTLINQYSGFQVDYNEIAVNPSIGEFTADSNEFPIFFFSSMSGAEDYEFARKCGSTHIHSWNPCVDDVNTSISNLINFMDIAQENGMKVVPYLSLHDRLDDPNGLSEIEQIATAVKDHNGMSFWHLIDEPESHAVRASEIEPFYDMLKDLTPTIPVGITHCWSTQIIDGNTYHWYDYDAVQDIFMNDLSIIHDEPFPTDYSIAPWNQQVKAISSCQYFLPQLQSHNKLYWGVGTWPSITADCRYPNGIEIRAWAYTSIIQGARGISWYGYYQALYPEEGSPIDRTWLEETFCPVNRELRKFVFFTKPAHDPDVIHDGFSTDKLYMAMWERPSGSFVVLVNGDPSERKVTMDTTGYLDNATLKPWGLSRDLEAEVFNNKLDVYMQPWEVLIWTVE